MLWDDILLLTIQETDVSSENQENYQENYQKDKILS